VFALVSEVIGAPPEPVFSQRVGAPFGVRDMLGFKTLDPSHRGVVMCTAVRSEVRISRRERRTWAMVGAHIAAGLRLRERLLARDARGSSPVEGADAVLEAGGRCVHAAGEARCRGAREALSTALRAIDRARGRRLDPAEALELWQALVSGRWSLVDWLDADGRRYVVARRNDAQVVDPRALSERERQVAAYLALGHGDKLIGYHTGIAASTVSNHVASVRRKLAAGSRTELVALLRGALAQPRPPRERAGRT
jgi:DNA-binding CsgD family transcriptional regulator